MIRQNVESWGETTVDVGRLDPRIRKWKLVEAGFLVLTIEGDPKRVIRKVMQHEPGMQFVIGVSPDVDLDDDENLPMGHIHSL